MVVHVWLFVWIFVLLVMILMLRREPNIDKGNTCDFDSICSVEPNRRGSSTKTASAQSNFVDSSSSSMASKKSCLYWSFRLASLLYSTQLQRPNSHLVFKQVLPLSCFSQLKAPAYMVNTQQKFFFASSPSSAVELLVSNDWSEATRKQLEESNVELSHEFVVYALKKLDKDPTKASEFFNWASTRQGFQPSSLIYGLLLRVLADKKTMKQFWSAIQEMKDKGFSLEEGTYLTILGNLNHAELTKDVAVLKHFYQRMIQDNHMGDEVRNVVVLVLGSDWNEEVESKLQDLQISVTDNLILRTLHKIRHYPLKAFRFFQWVGKDPEYQHSSVAYNMLARILAQPDSIKEFQNVAVEMKRKGHQMDYDTYIKISRSFQKCKMIKEAVELYESMMDGPYPPSQQDCILLLKSVSTNRDMDLALRVVNKFEAAGNTLSKALYDSIHRTLTSIGKFDEAQKIVENMESAGYKPDNITYSQLVFGLCRAGRSEDACKVLDEMETKGCDPDIKTWTILIQGLCGTNQMNKALLVFAKMMEKNIDPDADLLGVLVNGFIAQKKLDGAYKLIVEMVDKASLKPWQATYKLLTEKLLEAGKLEEALKVLAMMKKHDYPPFAEPFVQYISKFGTVEDAKTFLRALSVKGQPSNPAYLFVLKSFINEGRHFEAKDLLFSFPHHIRSHKEVSNLFGATKS